MLVLSRQRDETIMIGDDIEITIVDIRGDKVRLGISAPNTIPVHRKEVYEAIQRENREAAKVKMEDLSNLPKPGPGGKLGSQGPGGQRPHRSGGMAGGIPVTRPAGEKPVDRAGEKPVERAGEKPAGEKAGAQPPANGAASGDSGARGAADPATGG